MKTFYGKLSGFFRLKGPGFWDLTLYLFKIEFFIVLLLEFFHWHLLQGRQNLLFQALAQATLIGTPIAVMVTSLLLFITNRIVLSILSSTSLFLFLMGIHYLKAKYLNFPLYLADYILLQEGAEVLTWLLNSPIGYATCLALSLVLIWLILKTVRISFVKTKRIFSATICLVTSLILICIFQFKTLDFEELYPKDTIKNSAVIRNGFLPFFVMTFRHLDTHEPEDYNEKTIAEIVNRYPEDEVKERAASNLVQKPDVIFYVIESLMDYESYGIQFAEEPMPFFKKLRAETGQSVFFSSAFGGNTIKPEFSLLTGLLPLHHPNPMVFLNRTSETFPGLCEALHSAGYQCVGMHSGTEAYFQRDRAYKKMNFDLFEGLQTVLKEADLPRVPGGHLADEVLVKRFLEHLDGPPTFAHLLTISTHAEYGHWPVEEKFDVVTPNLPTKAKEQLQRYASAIHQADLAFAKLVAGLKAKGRPFILFSYGDHAPGLFQVYDAMPMTRTKRWERYDKFKTPMIILSSEPVKPGPMGITLSPNLMITVIEQFSGKIPKLPLQFRIAKEIRRYWDAVSTVMVAKWDPLESTCRHASLSIL